MVSGTGSGAVGGGGGWLEGSRGGRGRAVDRSARCWSGGLDGTCSPVIPTNCGSARGAALGIHQSGSPTWVEASDSPSLAS